MKGPNHSSFHSGPETPRVVRLTKRQEEIARWIAEGKSNSDIAGILGLSLQTVKNHVSAILERIGAENRTAVAIYVLRGRMARGEGSVLE
jgi:DNA-binding NarL/FixJ family response regulator